MVALSGYQWSRMNSTNKEDQATLYLERVTLLFFSIQSMAVSGQSSKGLHFLKPFNTHSETSPESLNLASEG